MATGSLRGVDSAEASPWEALCRAAARVPQEVLDSAFAIVRNFCALKSMSSPETAGWQFDPSQIDAGMGVSDALAMSDVQSAETSWPWSAEELSLVAHSKKWVSPRL